MYIIPALLFALSANIDSFIIGISCGIRNTKITVSKSLFIGFITLCGTFAALLTGGGICTLFRAPFAEYIGKLILLVFGLYYVLKFLMMRYVRLLPRKSPSNEEASDVTANACSEETASVSSGERMLSYKTSCMFGLSLSANNFGIGLGASIGGLSVIPASLISFFVSFLFLLLGNRAGRSPLFQKSGQYADLFCGVLLLLLGILN